MGNENISYAVALSAGFLTFLSPCLLPIIPSFIAYITGVSFSDINDPSKAGSVRKKALLHSIFFILGFSIVFILLGLTASFIGKALWQYQKAIQIAGGLLIVIFGLYLTGILKFDFLGKEFKIKFRSEGASYLGSFLIGITFAAAWTPCAGPILGAILVLAGTKSSLAEGAKLLSVFSIGIATPFLITALFIDAVASRMNKLKKFMSILNLISGIFLIIVGVLIMTNYLGVISGRLTEMFSGSEGV